MNSKVPTLCPLYPLYQIDQLGLIEKLRLLYHNCGFLYLLQHPSWGEYLKFGTTHQLRKRLRSYEASLTSFPTVLRIYFLTNNELVESKLIQHFQTKAKPHHKEFVHATQTEIETFLSLRLKKDEALSRSFQYDIYHYRGTNPIAQQQKNDPEEEIDLKRLHVQNGFVTFSPEMSSHRVPIVKRTSLFTPSLASHGSLTTQTAPVVSHDASLKGIQFYSPPDAWYACVQYQYDRRAKSFGFLQYGGADGALKRAKEWRDKTMVEMQQTQRVQQIAIEGNQEEKKVVLPRGIRNDTRRRALLVTVQRTVQRRKCAQRRYFSYQQTGMLRALELAEQWQRHAKQVLQEHGLFSKQHFQKERHILKRRRNKKSHRIFISASRFQAQAHESYSKINQEAGENSGPLASCL